MTKGIIIIATGHWLYGRLAYNLAVSIKSKDKSLPVALVYNESSLSHLMEHQLKLFDHLIPSVDDWRSIRFNIPEITPFDHTLFLDADQVWLKENPAAVFDILQNTNFTCVNEGYYDIETKEKKTNWYTWGCNVEDLIKHYKLKKGKLWKVRGEFFLFKKSKKVTELFKKAGEYCAAPKIETRPFAGGNPTEWAFDVAMNKGGFDCHESRWQPTYWPLLHKGRVPALWELNKEYYTLSAGGARISPDQKRLYDLAMEASCYALGLRHVFPLQPKNYHIKERKLNYGKAVIQ